MRAFTGLVAAAAAIATVGCTTAAPSQPGVQPIIDMHRHTPWPRDPDAGAPAQIAAEMDAANVVAAMLFITGTEDSGIYTGAERRRFVFSPMFPCPLLSATEKWCFTDSTTGLPDIAWLEAQLAARKLHGIGELAFSYAAMDPRSPEMAPYWDLAARFDVPAFVHTGKGPGPGQGPRRHAGCCPDYREEYGNPALLEPILQRHPKLRVSLQHAGFDFVDETVALMRAYPNVYLDMSVLNSVGPEELHAASLKRFVDEGFADRIMLGSDDLPYAAIKARVEAADFLTPAQRRGIYYDNAARFLRLDARTIADDYAR